MEISALKYNRFDRTDTILIHVSILTVVEVIIIIYTQTKKNHCQWV